MKLTSVFTQNIKAFNNGSRFIINQGGTSSSKTWSILQLLTLIAMRKKGLLISIVSESLPHLKRGAMRDFQKILNTEGIYTEEQHNKSSNSFNIGESVIEFFSADDSSKMRGARRDILFVNECNNIHKSAFDELSVRTKQCTFLDFNPVAEFWAHEFMHSRSESDFTFIKSTYRDNQYLDSNIVAEIEKRKVNDPNWYKVFGEGEIGNYEGVVFSNWGTVTAMPETAKRIIGLDFGFTNDPTTLIDIRYSNGEIFVDELCYQTGMTNRDIANLIKSEGDLITSIVVCDSAEPKSIEELKLFGVKSIPADKGADSIRNGIDLLLQYRINVTKRSTNVVKELRNYRWKTDKNGKSLNVPIDYFNHSIDALRYGATYLLGSATKSIKPKIHIPK